MPLLNFTFQESSPLITYSPGWVDGRRTNDTSIANYNGSFRVTSTPNATAMFTFSGTAVSLFGATRPNHGNYSVKLDQQPLFQGVGFTPSGNFNKSLWHADNLRYDEHTVTLKNVPTPRGSFLDLDYVSIARQIGSDGDRIFQTAFDDGSPAVKYMGTWERTAGSSTAYQGTLHTTNVAGAQAVISFRGCCVELYGQYANAPYSVTLDSQTPVNIMGRDVDLTSEFQHPQTLLYLIDGLSESDHTVTLMNVKSNANRPFVFDYAIVRSTQNITTNGTPPPNTSGSTSSNGDESTRGSPPVGAIVGGAVGGAVVLALLIFGFFFMRRRRHRGRDRAKDWFPLDLVDESGLEPKPYILPNHSEMQPTNQKEYSGAGPMPPSKRHQVADYYPHGEEGPLDREQSTAGRSNSYSMVSSAGTGEANVTTSSTILPKSVPVSGRRPKRRASPSQHVAENTEDLAVQEEDAGAILPQNGSVTRTLPPAYNLDWDSRDDP